MESIESLELKNTWASSSTWKHSGLQLSGSVGPFFNDNIKSDKFRKVRAILLIGFALVDEQNYFTQI